MTRLRALLHGAGWGAAARRLFAPDIRYYALVLAFCTVVFAITPFSIYAHSDEPWGFPIARLLPLAALGLALFALLALLVRLLAALHPGAARTVSIALFCGGVFLLLAHVYAPIQIGPLDGSSMVSAEPALHSLIELALLALVVWIFLSLRRGRGLGVAALFSLGLVLVGVGYAGVLTLTERAAPVAASEAAAAPSNGTAASSGITGNVYHFVLDRMQTDAFQAVLERSPQAAEFVGFDLFKNNMANYISTNPSSASYLTGTLYKGGDYRSWVRGWRDRGLFATLAERGYETWMYAPIEGWKGLGMDHFRYNIDLYEEEAGVADAGLGDLLQVWLISLAPNPLTNEAVPVAAAARGPLFELLTSGTEPLSIADGVDPYAGMLMLRKLRREEAQMPPDGRYVYAHAALPHTPFVLDSRCRYVGTGRSVKAGYLDQAECAVVLIGEFLAELRRLGRYDAATILVHSDTGHGLGGIAGQSRPAGRRTLGVSEIGLVYTLQALLMIKPPHANGPLRMQETPTQLVDLFPTVLDLLELEPGYEIEGKSVYAIKPDERRPARFGFDPDKLMNGPNVVQVQVDDPSNLAQSSLTVLGPASDPQTWRNQSP
jgi:hypothetical protein